MAGKSVVDRLEPDVLAQLRDSGTIKVKCLPNNFRKTPIRIVSLPEVLACAVSSCFRDLCKDTKKRIFTSDDVMGETFKNKWDTSSFYDDVCRFQKWLYGGSLLEIPGNCYDHWFFGQRIGSPMFQNDAMRHLVSTVDVKKKTLYDMFIDRYDSEDPGLIWQEADFTVDDELGYEDELEEVHWGNKQMLKFVLDVFAFVGIQNEDVAAAISQGGPSAVHIAKLSEALARRGRSCGAPWEEKNLHKYLVDERLPTSSADGSIAAYDSDQPIAASDDEEKKKINLKKESSAADGKNITAVKDKKTPIAKKEKKLGAYEEKKISLKRKSPSENEYYDEEE